MYKATMNLIYLIGHEAVIDIYSFLFHYSFCIFSVLRHFVSLQMLVLAERATPYPGYLSILMRENL